ncbi:MAG: HEAT repeat domain-containing protein [Spirochaetia bacterium]|jgi:HEAT repeat protein
MSISVIMSTAEVGFKGAAAGGFLRFAVRPSVRVLTVVLALCIGPAAVLSAQQATSATPQKEITIEELFLQSVEFQILREKAFSGDYDIKVSALDDLEKKVNDGSYKSSDQQVEFVLEYLALEGSARTTRELGRLVNDFPEVRRRATNLLGRVGTEDAKNALVRVLLIDEEPVVKAEAAYALGVIGKNDNNEVVEALAYTYNKEDPTKPDNNFGYALCLAIEKLAKKSGGIKDPAAYQMLVKIAQGNYLRTVKTKALQVLDELKSSK